MTRVQVKPELLRWACERSRIDELELSVRFPHVEAWERGEKQPTIKQLEAFAKATHTPLGYFFLPEPPVERLPIQDFRTVREDVARPSADLLDTIYAMQRRQDFLREERRDGEGEPLDFVGSARLADDPEAVGREMRRVVGLDDGWAGAVKTWTEAVGELRRRTEKLGVIAVINGVVGNNTSRKLDVHEFRGFALTDSYAPLVFVNGANAKSAQMVAGRRAMDLRLVGREAFFKFYKDYTKRERDRVKAASGGDFYNTQNTRLGQSFALAVMRAALEGRLSFKEAYDLTGLRGGAFQEYGRRLGVPLP